MTMTPVQSDRMVLADVKSRQTYVCSKCDWQFARHDNLKRHELKHTKEKPFGCSDCGHAYTRRDALLRHKSQIHSSGKAVVMAMTEQVPGTGTSSRQNERTTANPAQPPTGKPFLPPSGSQEQNSVSVGTRSNTTQSKSPQHTVVIIGAGIAGAKAAVDLTRNGVDVVMLEALDRTGGRLLTFRDHAGRCFDLGASWLHDTLQNELFDYAYEKGIPMHYDDGETAFYTQGHRISHKSRAHRVMSDAEVSAKLDYEDLELEDRPLKDYITEFVNTHPLVSDFNKRVVPQMVRYLELWHAIPWDRASTRYGIPEDNGRHAIVLGGYDRLYDLTYDQINHANFELRLNSEVKHVSHSGEGYTIETASGESLTAQYVIVTIPAGALKYTHRELFAPGLIPDTLGSIMDDLEIAGLGKFLVEFEDIFWSRDIDNFVILADKEPVDGADPIPEAYPLTLINGFPIFGSPSLLVLTPPPLTQYLEANDKHIHRFFEPAFLSVREDALQPLPKVTWTKHTTWTQNRFFRGSYSALRVGQDYYAGLIPFIDGAGRVRFAGEHTTIEANGCVHGAFATGRREAKWILDDLNGNTPLPYSQQP